MTKIPCSVQILTRNSAKTFERCLESVKDFAEILVLDGNSTDGTQDIAKSYGCRVIKQYDTDEPNVVIRNYSEVRNKGLKMATHDWSMYIDSDEYLSAEAVAEIRSIVESQNPKAYAWWQPRKYVIDSKIIDCATTYPNRQIRLFHRDYSEGFIKPIHERIKIKFGTDIGNLKNFEYVPLGTLPELKERWDRYMEWEIKANLSKPRSKLILLSLRSILLFGLYFWRYLKNLFLCRGSRLPLSYEWARHKYLLVLAYKLAII